MLRFIPLHRAIFTYFKDYFSYLVMKRVIFFKVQLCTPTFRNRKVEKILCVYLTDACFGRKKIIHFHLHPIPPLFGIEKVHKRFSPLKRRSESAASSPHIKLSSVKLSRTSEILNLRSQMLRTARWGRYLCTS